MDFSKASSILRLFMGNYREGESVFSTFNFDIIDEVLGKDKEFRNTIFELQEKMIILPIVIKNAELTIENQGEYSEEKNQRIINTLERLEFSQKKYEKIIKSDTYCYFKVKTEKVKFLEDSMRKLSLLNKANKEEKPFVETQYQLVLTEYEEEEDGTYYLMALQNRQQQQITKDNLFFGIIPPISISFKNVVMEEIDINLDEVEKDKFLGDSEKLKDYTKATFDSYVNFKKMLLEVNILLDELDTLLT